MIERLEKADNAKNKATHYSYVLLYSLEFLLPFWTHLKDNMMLATATALAGKTLHFLSSRKESKKNPGRRQRVVLRRGTSLKAQCFPTHREDSYSLQARLRTKKLLSSTDLQHPLMWRTELNRLPRPARRADDSLDLESRKGNNH